MITRLGGSALYCYSDIKVVIGCIPFFKRAEMVVEGGLKKLFYPLTNLRGAMDCCGLFNLGHEDFGLLVDLVELYLLLLGDDKLLVDDGVVHLVLQDVHLQPKLGQLNLKSFHTCIAVEL